MSHFKYKVDVITVMTIIQQLEKWLIGDKYNNLTNSLKIHQEETNHKFNYNNKKNTSER